MTLHTFSTGVCIHESNIVLINDVKEYEKNKLSIDQEVQKGSTALFLSIDTVSYPVGGSQIHVIPTTMGQNYFASPNLMHPLMKEFKPLDFKFLYNSNAEYATPFLSSFFTGSDWESMLTSGNPNWTAEKGIAYAVAQKSLGKGKIVICQLQLAGIINQNPVVFILLKRIVEKKMVFKLTAVHVKKMIKWIS